MALPQCTAQDTDEYLPVTNGTHEVCSLIPRLGGRREVYPYNNRIIIVNTMHMYKQYVLGSFSLSRPVQEPMNLGIYGMSLPDGATAVYNVTGNHGSKFCYLQKGNR